MSGAGRRPEAVFFDVGYTLVWFQPSVREIAQIALREIGVEATDEQIHEAFHAVWRKDDEDAATRRFPATEAYDQEMQIWREREFLRGVGVEDEARLAAYIARVAEIYRAPGTLRLYDDVLPALDRLQRAGMRLGIVSNWSWNLRRRLEQVGLQYRFDAVVASAYAGCQKPNPDIFRQALEQMGVVAERVVHIGDLYATDVVGARAAGIEPILLDRYGKAGEVDCPVIRSLDELPDWADGAL
jgi:putative hydrolase of the HAD superfamily